MAEKTASAATLGIGFQEAFFTLQVNVPESTCENAETSALPLEVASISNEPDQRQHQPLKKGLRLGEAHVEETAGDLFGGHGLPEPGRVSTGLVEAGAAMQSATRTGLLQGVS